MLQHLVPSVFLERSTFFRDDRRNIVDAMVACCRGEKLLQVLEGENGETSTNTIIKSMLCIMHDAVTTIIHTYGL
jgi:hypothetical protein